MRMQPKDRQLRRGVAAVELAVLLPFLLLLFLVALDFGRVFYGLQVVSQCSRGGAFYESFRNDPLAYAEMPYASVQQATVADGSNLSLNSGTDVAVVYGTTSNGAPMVEVRTTHRFQSITNALSIPNPFNVSRGVKMREVPLVPDFN